jgi:hypothetical protein
MAEDLRTYTRAELEEVAGLAAGAASGVFLRKFPDEVMPTEDISECLGLVLADFDERRGSAAGYTAEQLSGTRSSGIGWVDEDEPYPVVSHEHRIDQADQGHKF